MLAHAALAVYGLALAGAAVSDVRRYEIPNPFPLAIAAAFVVYAPALPVGVILSQLSAGLVVLIVAALCFGLGLMGGGDAKLLAATALWVGWLNLPVFLLAMSLLGAAISLILIFIRRISWDVPGPGRWYARLLSRGGGVPYGVAICGAGLALLPHLAAAVADRGP